MNKQWVEVWCKRRRDEMEFVTLDECAGVFQVSGLSYVYDTTGIITSCLKNFDTYEEAAQFIKGEGYTFVSGRMTWTS